MAKSRRHAGRRPQGTPPPLLIHKTKKVHYVSYNGKMIYLGKVDSPEARRAYADFIQDWERSQAPGLSRPKGPVVRVLDLVTAFLDHAQTYYRRADGTNTSEYADFKRSLQPLIAKHQDKNIAQLRSRDVKEIVDDWVKAGLARKTINQHLGRVKRLFRWGVEEEYVPDEIAGAITMIRPLQTNRTPAPDYPEVLPAPWSAILKVMRSLRQRSPAIVSMIRLQYLCGCRPGEIVRLKRSELHQGGEVRIKKRTITLPPGVWAFMPSQYKTKHKGKIVVYYLGPRSQAILKPWLERAQAENREYLFPSRLARRQYMRQDSYCNEVAKACEEIACPEWTPGQLRHNYLTRMDRKAGLEAASVSVGHSSIETTLIYVERDSQRSAALAHRLG